MRLLFPLLSLLHFHFTPSILANYVLHPIPLSLPHSLRPDATPQAPLQHNLSTPLSISVQHLASASEKIIRFQLATILPSEHVQNLSYTISDHTIITDIDLSQPRRKGSKNRWTATAHLFMQASVGQSFFTLTATTDNPHVIYSKRFLLTVAGLSINIQGETVSGSNRTGILLGSFRSWLHLRQIAVPIKVQPLSQHTILPVDTRVELDVFPLRSAVPVDAVAFDAAECAGRVETEISLENGDDGSDAMTLFMRDQKMSFIGSAHLPAKCGVGISPDAGWLIIRLEPYRVSAYGFQVEIRWKGPAEDGFFPSRVVLNFHFDDRAIPPPLMQNLSTSLDAFGGELLRIPITNIFSPPRLENLTAENFVVQMQTGDGEIQKSSARALVQGEVYPELVFDTPAWKNESMQILTISVLFREGALYEEESRERGDLAILSPDASVSVLLASSDLAQLDGCEVGDGFEKGRFVRVELGVRQYQADTFSGHKNGQIVGELGGVFGGREAVRLVEVRDGGVTYGVLIGEGEGEVAGGVERLRERVSEIGMAVMLDVDDVREERIMIEERSLCSVFPLLEGREPVGRRGGEVDGLQAWGIALIAVGGIAGLVLVGLMGVKVSGWVGWAMAGEESVRWSEGGDEDDDVGGGGRYEVESRESMWIESESSMGSGERGGIVSRIGRFLDMCE